MKFSEIKKLANVTNEWKNLVPIILDNDLDFEKVYRSLKDSLITVSEFETSNYLEDVNYYYDDDNYCIDYYGNIIDKDDAFYCEYYEEYFPSEEYNEINDGRSSIYWSDRAINNASDIFKYNGIHYTSNGLSYNDLVIDIDGDIYPMDELYYWQSDGEYHHEPEEEEESEEYLRPYHNGGYKKVEFEGSKTKYTIGFEIEKEDKEVLESIYISDFENKLPKWRKERDGSLDDNSGFELISPIFPFDIKKIFDHINEEEILKNHINANYSYSCGGHINLGHKEKSGKEIFELIAGYTPLLYSLYYGRINKNYSKAKSNKDLKDDNEKYQAIKIHSDRIEFRIFSAVSNIDTLKWRCDLINLMLKYPTNDVKKAFYFIETRFNSLLKKQYATKERMQKLKDRIKENSMKFEKIDLSK